MSFSRIPRQVRAIGVLAAVGAAGAGTVAAAGDSPAGLKVGKADAVELTAARAMTHDCTRAWQAGTPGVARQSWSAPRDGYLTVRAGSPRRRGDWDLALFDAAGRKLVASQGFRASEVVQAPVLGGGRYTIQACRQSGAGASIPVSTQFVGLRLTRGAKASKTSHVKVRLANAQSVEVLRGLGLDLGEDANRREVSVILHSDAERAALTKAGFRFRTIVDDLEAFDRRERAKDRAYTKRLGAKGSPLPSGRTEYRTFEDVQAELKKLIADNPKIAKGFTMPKQTFQGRDQQGIEIAVNPGVEDGRPTFGLIGMHHAREWPSVETTMEFAYELIEGYKKKDPRIMPLMRGVRTKIVPIINGDGYVASRSAPLDPDPDGEVVIPAVGNTNLITGLTGTLAYRRKNCNGIIPSPAVPCELQLGVDPNRNYGFNWGGPGAGTAPPDQDYRGTGPWSETETQSVHEWSRVNNFTTFLTVHNVAALVLRPPGLSTVGQAPDEKRLKVLGDSMAKATGYTSQFGYELYDTSGTTEDWNYGSAGTFGYTIEIGPPSGEFHQSYETGVVEQYAGTGKLKGLREAYLLAAENARELTDHSVIKGRAPAGRTLRVKKTFKTKTGDVCTVSVSIVGRVGGEAAQQGCYARTAPMEIDDFVEYTMVVGKRGSYTWHLPPSTRPFEAKAGKRETYTLTCEQDGRVIETKEVFVARGAAVKADLRCGGRKKR